MQLHSEDILPVLPARFRFEIELIGLPERINEFSGSCWQRRHRERQKWHKRFLGKMILTRQTPPLKPLQKAKLTLIRHSSRTPDFDGLVISFKPIVDCLKHIGFIQDDNMDVIGMPDYKWIKCKPKAGKIQILVEEV